MEEVERPPLNDHVTAFAEAFIVRERRKRFVQLAESASAVRATPKTQAKLDDFLCHGLQADLDERYWRELAHREELGFNSVDKLQETLDLLLTEFDGSNCYIISRSHPLGFTEAPILEAFSAETQGDLNIGCDGTIYSFIPGKLALYKQEIGPWILCKRSE